MELHNPHMKPKVYDAWNVDHQDWLMWWLDRMSVRFSELDQVGFGLHKKSTDEMEAVVNRVKRQRKTPDDPWEFVPPCLRPMASYQSAKSSTPPPSRGLSPKPAPSTAPSPSARGANSSLSAARKDMAEKQRRELQAKQRQSVEPKLPW